MTEKDAKVLFSAGETAGMVGGACKGNLSALISKVVVDSRAVAPGALFVALPGERVDGHDFILQALERGASCIMADAAHKARLLASLETVAPAGGTALENACILFVDSTLAGLQALAREHRRRMKALFRVGVTGSSGKTTTKECIGAALAPAFPAGTLAMNEGNLNSDIGLALSMFDLNEGHRLGVFEMGMNRKGEMAELAAIYEPDIAVITNIGTAHIGMIGSRQGIAEEKKAIFSRFDGRQTALIREDEAFAEFLSQGLRGTMRRFGPNSTEGLRMVKDLALRGWELDWEGETFVFPLPGRHNLQNALAALSVAEILKSSGFDIPAAAVAKGLSSVKPLFGRSELFEGRVSLLRDCYNANPDSMAAAMEFCDGLEVRGRKLYVLGSMRELGESSRPEHVAMGERAAASTADSVFFFGEETEDSHQAFLARGLSKARVFRTDDIEALKDAVFSELRDGDFILVKASRSLALERLADRLFEAGYVSAGETQKEGKGGHHHAA